MCKYTTSRKRAAVAAYFNNEGSLTALTERFEIDRPERLRAWIRVYRYFGPEALERPLDMGVYPYRFIAEVIRCYRELELCEEELAEYYQLKNAGQVIDWVDEYLVQCYDSYFRFGDELNE